MSNTQEKELKILQPRSKFKYAVVVKKLTEAFSIGCTVSEACLYADISRTTYYAWIKNNLTLKNRFEQLLETPTLQARQTVVKDLKHDSKIALKY